MPLLWHKIQTQSWGSCQPPLSHHLKNKAKLPPLAYPANNANKSQLIKWHCDQMSVTLNKNKEIPCLH